MFVCLFVISCSVIFYGDSKENVEEFLQLPKIPRGLPEAERLSAAQQLADRALRLVSGSIPCNVPGGIETQKIGQYEGKPHVFTVQVYFIV